MLQEINQKVQQKLSNSKEDILKFVFNRNIDNHSYRNCGDCEYCNTKNQYIIAKKQVSYFNKKRNNYYILYTELEYYEERRYDSLKLQKSKFWECQQIKNSNKIK
jgi:hypothetical protein